MKHLMVQRANKHGYFYVPPKIVPPAPTHFRGRITGGTGAGVSTGGGVRGTGGFDGLDDGSIEGAEDGGQIQVQPDSVKWRRSLPQETA